MSSECLYAYTAPFPNGPEYVNLSGQDNGSTILTVRTQGEGNTSRINLPPEQLIALGKAMVRRGELVLGIVED